MTTEQQAFFDTLRLIDARVDALRSEITAALLAGTLTAMCRSYVLGEYGKQMVLSIQIDPVMPDVADALAGLVDAVTDEVNEKGAGGYLLARLADAKESLAHARRK